MKKIILVEDDAAIRDVFSMALDPEKYEVLTYERGDSLLAGQTEVPDLFVLDKSIAGSNGLDICRFIKKSQQYHLVPVVILSASPDIVTSARQAGADDTITKPFTLKTLRTVIEKYTTQQG
ncbi:response regulator [Chitinophaga pendula]|uniref:response regulator n=1 Tax=Chitinophaga TaxID=79328 RepID=UPI000BAF9F7F|nr:MULTISPECIES: response regulator [Chitinophaga]ASZ10754.1 response regulator [Chitinophaga sp. MD30]UCJ06271.1 response regulator [Chitinophaga pendula]